MISWLMVVIVGLSLCLSFGCATSYGPMGLSGGYKDAHIKDNLYFVEVAYNGYTDQTTGVTYLHRRAQELCAENGYITYALKDERFDTYRRHLTAYVECLRQHSK